MKKISLIFTVLTGIAFLLPVSCAREELAQDVPTGRELILDIDVEGMATRAAGDALADDSALREDALDLLDLFISGTFSNENSEGFAVKHYALTPSVNKMGDGKWKVLDDWRTEGFVEGYSYSVYVAANSKRIKNGNDYTSGIGSLNLSGITSDAELQAALQGAIEYDYDPTEPNTDGGTKPFWGAHNDDKLNPEWLDVHKKYIESMPTQPSDQQKRYYTEQKSFLMDGKASFTARSSSETTSILLSRAAAKIILNVSFDGDFLTSVGKVPMGDPAWQFVNFAFTTPVFNSSTWTTPGSPYDLNSVFTAGAIMQSVAGDTELHYNSNDYGFSLSTYSYPLKWDKGFGDDGEPGIIISVNYKASSSDPNNFQYYKIPVVDPSLNISSLDRNKVYRISAMISSEGGVQMTDAYDVKCQFDILPWGELISGQDVNNALEKYYFTVTPTDIVLRGDGLQTAEIKIIKPRSKNIGLQYYVMGDAVFDEPFKVAGSNSQNTLTEYPFSNNVAEGQPAPYYFNYAGTRRTAFTRELARGGVVYGNTSHIQNKFTRSESGDKLTLESYALPNRGIKYMKVRVYMAGVSDYLAKGYYQDITIRHYPTNYLTSIEGAWSSRKSAGAALPNGHRFHQDHTAANYGPEEYAIDTETTYYKEEYDEWEDDGTLSIQTGSWSSTYAEYKRSLQPDGVDFTMTHETTANSRQKYLNNTALPAADQDPNFIRTLESYAHAFHNDGTEIDSNKKAQHGSEATAFDWDGWYYWGETPSEVDEDITLGPIRKDPNLIGQYSAPVESDFGTPSFTNPYDYYIAGEITYVQQGSGLNRYRNYYLPVKAYRYASHYRASYQEPVYTRLHLYSHSGYGPNTALINAATSGDLAHRLLRWVNWEQDQNGYGSIVFRTNSQAAVGDIGGTSGASYAPFASRTMYNGNMHLVKDDNTSAHRAARSNQLNNLDPHIYILRFSVSSASHTLGHPSVNSLGMSKDRVTAPALMIASQLGGTQDLPSPGTVNNTTHGTSRVVNETERQYWSARHCATYLEVGKSGIMMGDNSSRYFYDWRLPTRQEMSLIINYQGTRDQSGNPGQAMIDGFTIYGDDRIIKPVLTSQYYYALDGSLVEVNNPQSSVRTVRCVRELTMEELEYLENL